MNREEREIFMRQRAEAAAHRRTYDYDPLDHNHDGVVTIEDGDTYFAHEGNDSVERTGVYADPYEMDDYEEEYCPDHGRDARERADEKKKPERLFPDFGERER